MSLPAVSLDALRGLPVAVLLGGDSPERDISRQGGAAVAAALGELGADVRPIDPAEPRWWQTLDGVSLAFILLHGPGGEDGVVQGALETLGVPYTGSGVLASALAMDKVAAKRLWQGLGLPTAAFVELRADSDWQGVIDSLGAVFVKPVDGGSSLGIGIARDAAELAQAWAAAGGKGGGEAGGGGGGEDDGDGPGPRVIAEQLVAGPEYTVAMLDGLALPAIKVETDGPFYDYQAKYHSDTTRYLCPCGLSYADEAALADLCRRAFDALGCEVWGRVDAMRDEGGGFQLLEVNTVPGMTTHSLVPMAAQAAGLTLPQLVGRIALASLRRWGQ